MELAPIDLLDWPAARGKPERLWIRGGFPESLLALDDAASMAWRYAFLRSYLERDVPMFAPRLPAETIGRLWTMLAHAQGTPLNQSRLAASLAVSSPAVGRYIDLLVDLLLVRRLRPWRGNVGKRLVKTPKTYIRDSGLTHALLDLETWDDVLGHPVSGPSWEGFVIDNLIAAAGDRRTPYYYRTADGAEVDLLFERGGRVEMMIEIKRSTAPELSKGFRLARAALEPEEALIVHGGDESWPLPDDITATSLEQLMARLAEGRDSKLPAS
jgi:predicted AAA+ superfamily ATPase